MTVDAKMNGIVRVEPYDPDWRVQFERIKAMIMECIGEAIIDVEHVGSTSVTGLAAKPIIDLDIVIDSYEVFPEVKNGLSRIGFEHEGDMGVEGREAFKRNFIDDFMPYHIYVCPKDGKGYLDHIAFRDYLRNHPETAEAYGQLKMRLAGQFRTDIKGYIDGKHDFVQNVMDEISRKEI